MIESTPLNCPRKPGEPGGEKLTEAERDQVLQLASNCWDRDWFPNSEDQQLLFDWIDRRVAGALAACALAEHDAICTDCRAHIDTKKYVRCKRGAALECAASGKS